MNLSRQKDSPGEGVPSPWERLLKVMGKYRQLAWYAFLITSFALFVGLMPSPMRLMIWHSLTARGILSGMLLVFSLLAISLVWSAGQRLDVWAFLVFNLHGRRPVWLDRLMLVFTQIGSGVVSLLVGVVLFLTVDRLLAYELILGTLTLWIVVEIVKAIVRRSRPFLGLAQARVVGYRAIGRSFPSGHTSQAFFMATLMARYFEAGALLLFLLYGTALLVGVTRMYVGAHYPRDVIAGALMGSSWGLLAMLVDEYLRFGIV